MPSNTNLAAPPTTVRCWLPPLANWRAVRVFPHTDAHLQAPPNLPDNSSLYATAGLSKSSGCFAFFILARLGGRFGFNNPADGAPPRPDHYVPVPLIQTFTHTLPRTANKR